MKLMILWILDSVSLCILESQKIEKSYQFKIFLLEIGFRYYNKNWNSDDTGNYISDATSSMSSYPACARPTVWKFVLLILFLSFVI